MRGVVNESNEGCKLLFNEILGPRSALTKQIIDFVDHSTFASYPNH